METVVIKTENGPVIINKIDFDPEKHVLYTQEKQVSSRNVRETHKKHLNDQAVAEAYAEEQKEDKPKRKYTRKSKD